MSKRILLIEDNPDDETLILMSLKERDVVNDIVIARDGQEALDYLFATGPHSGRDRRVLPTVILLDLHLPRVDGLEVLQRIRGDSLTRLVPVVIMTSSDEEEDRIASYDLGANSYVRKPVDFSEFARAVKEVKLYWLLVNTPPTP
jgi:two-component system response regulator